MCCCDYGNVDFGRFWRQDLDIKLVVVLGVFEVFDDCVVVLWCCLVIQDWDVIEVIVFIQKFVQQILYFVGFDEKQDFFLFVFKFVENIDCCFYLGRLCNYGFKCIRLVVQQLEIVWVKRDGFQLMQDFQCLVVNMVVQFVKYCVVGFGLNFWYFGWVEMVFFEWKIFDCFVFYLVDVDVRGVFVFFGFGIFRDKDVFVKFVVEVFVCCFELCYKVFEVFKVFWCDCVYDCLEF